MNVADLVTKDQIEPLCRKYHIRKMSLFGSVVRADFSTHSDIDILVEFEPGHIPGFDFFLIEAELSQLLGRKIDLQTRQFLSPEILESVLLEAVPVYEQA